ncbi:hypothetical protein [Roseobacter sp. HKCCD7870]|uniref:hypothetical protein n=1 Tax=Roseobacter sp. HKCCD7870 TaxID=3120343 RepID=UPI0030ED3488
MILHIALIRNLKGDFVQVIRETDGMHPVFTNNFVNFPSRSSQAVIDPRHPASYVVDNFR